MTVSLDSITTPTLARQDEDRWQVVYPSQWVSFAGVLGGLVVGHAVSAAAEFTGRAPTAVTTHFHAPVLPDLLTDYTVAELRSGRSATSATVVGSQDGRPRISAQVFLTDSRHDLRASTWAPTAAPAAAGPELLDRLELPQEFVPFSQFLDIRPVNDARPGGGGTDPRFLGWIRSLSGASGHEAVAIALDTFPPSLFALWTTPRPVPTAEITMHFAALPDAAEFDPWYLVDQRTTWASADYSLDDATVFSRSGRIVAQARQVRRIVPM